MESQGNRTLRWNSQQWSHCPLERPVVLGGRTLTCVVEVVINPLEGWHRALQLFPVNPDQGQRDDGVMSIVYPLDHTFACRKKPNEVTGHTHIWSAQRRVLERKNTSI